MLLQPLTVPTYMYFIGLVPTRTATVPDACLPQIWGIATLPCHGQVSTDHHIGSCAPRYPCVYLVLFAYWLLAPDRRAVRCRAQCYASHLPVTFCHLLAASAFLDTYTYTLQGWRLGLCCYGSCRNTHATLPSSRMHVFVASVEMA